jgi:hypothetical protein
MRAPEGLPAYLEYREGRTPVVVVAPHGGVRGRDARRHDGINDVYTAELARDLATRLDAFAVVNARLDRNEIDLNRVSEIAARAPEMARVLRYAVERAAGLGSVPLQSGEPRGMSACPLVLWVHGWNVSTLSCDIGIGLREIAGELVGAFPTVTPDTVSRFVEPLRHAMAEVGLEGFLGHRYPASGRDNATQIFSGRHADHANSDVAGLACLALEGGAEAVQLELSIALRWPGEYRERWLSAVVAATSRFLATTRAPAGTQRCRSWAPSRHDVPAPAEATAGRDDAVGESVQSVLADGSGLFLGLEVVGRTGFTARICVAHPDGRLALVVCEAPWSGTGQRFSAAGLEWLLGRSLRYRGPAVVYSSHRAFLDLERGLRASEVSELEVDVDLGRAGSECSGSHGHVHWRERATDIGPPFVRRPGGRFTGERGVRARVTLVDDQGRTLVIEERREQENPDAQPRAGIDGDVRAGAMPIRAMARIAGSVLASASENRLVVSAPGRSIELVGRITVRVPVFRPTSDGKILRIEFGVVEWIDAEAYGPHGLYELVTPSE